jgi:hypothetical protein
MSLRPTVMNSFGTTDAATQPGTGVTLSGASQTALPANPQRVAAYFSAPAAAVTLSLGGTAVAGQGLVIPPNTIFKLEGYSGQVNVIGTAAQVLGVVDL